MAILNKFKKIVDIDKIKSIVTTNDMFGYEIQQKF